MTSSPRKRILEEKHNPLSKKRKITFDDASACSNNSEEESNLSSDNEIDWDQLEKELEENAAKANLTAINVKSILHHILSDKRVIEYAQTIAKNPNADVPFKTKLTRSKTKLIGEDALCLPRCSRKTRQSPPRFLDIDFPDSSSSSDNEYDPEDDDDQTSQASEEESVFSDVLNDSNVSTSMSHLLDSPNALSKKNENTQLKSTELIEESIQDPVTSIKSSEIDQASELEQIALRTRSRCPMPNIEVQELEALFQPPDSDVLDFTIKDPDDPDEVIWKNWLADFMKPLKALNDANDEQDEDFNYMAADADEDVELEEELRNDKATRITQKEMQELFNELLLSYQPEETQMNSSNLDGEDSLLNEMLVPQDAVDVQLSPDQRLHVTAQMQQHLQLVCQLYILSCNCDDFKSEASTCKQYIEELAMFDKKARENMLTRGTSSQKSLFCTPGVHDALRMIQKCDNINRVADVIGKVKRKSALMDIDAARIIATEPYFATFNELIPESAINVPSEKTRKRPKFSKFEDNLLAMGLVQFTGKNNFELISEHLLPVWTAKQLKMRVKNIVSRHDTNAVAVYKREKILSGIDCVNTIKVPREISTLSLVESPRSIWKGRLMPRWYSQNYRRFSLELMGEEHMEEHVKRHSLHPIYPKVSCYSAPLQLNTLNCTVLHPTTLFVPCNNSNKNPAVLGNCHFAETNQSSIILTAPLPFCLSSKSSPLKNKTSCVSETISIHSGKTLITHPQITVSSQEQLFASQTNESSEIVGKETMSYKMKANTEKKFDLQSKPSLIQGCTEVSKAPSNTAPVFKESLHQTTVSQDTCHGSDTSPSNTDEFSQHNSPASLSDDKTSSQGILSEAIPIFAVKTNTSVTAEKIDPDQCRKSTNLVNDVCSQEARNQLEKCVAGMSPEQKSDRAMESSRQVAEKIQIIEHDSAFVSNMLTDANRRSSVVDSGCDGPQNNMSSPTMMDEMETSPKTSVQQIGSIKVSNIIAIPENNELESNIANKSNLATVLYQVSLDAPQNGPRVVTKHATCGGTGLPGKDAMTSPVKDAMTSPGKDSIVSPGNDDMVSPRNDSIVSPRNDDIVSPGKDGMVSPGNDGMVSPGNDDMVSPGNDGVVSPGNDGMVSPGNDDMVSPGNDGIVSPRNDHIVSLGKDGMTSPGNDGVIPPGNDGMIPPGNDGMIPPGNDGVIPPGNDGVIPPGKDGNSSFAQIQPCCKLKGKTRGKTKRKCKEVFNYAEQLKEKAKDFAARYFHRVRETLKNRTDLCDRFFQLMEDVTDKQLTNLETYHLVKELLHEYPGLVDNFCGFLTQNEACHVGKFLEWLSYDQVIRFHLSCEEHFIGHPGWYQKITQKIVEATETLENPQAIVDAVTPMFKGSIPLTHQFIRLFPDLPPPLSNTDDYEVIDFSAVKNGFKEIDDFEEVMFHPRDPNHEIVKPRKKELNHSNTNILACKLRRLAREKKIKVKTKNNLTVASKNGAMRKLKEKLNDDLLIPKEDGSMHEYSEVRIRNNAGPENVSLGSMKRSSVESNSCVVNPRNQSLEISSNNVDFIIIESKTTSTEQHANEKPTDVKGNDEGSVLNQPVDELLHSEDAQFNINYASDITASSSESISNHSIVENLFAVGNLAENSNSSCLGKTVKRRLAKHELITLSNETELKDNSFLSCDLTFPDDRSIQQQEHGSKDLSFKGKFSPVKKSNPPSKSVAVVSPQYAERLTDIQHCSNADDPISNDPREGDEEQASQEAVPWTREDDRVILSSVRELGETEAAFEKIRSSIHSKSLSQIKCRLKFLLEMIELTVNSESSSEEESS